MDHRLSSKLSECPRSKLQGTAEQILVVLVPETFEQLVKLPKTVSEGRNPAADRGAHR